MLYEQEGRPYDCEILQAKPAFERTFGVVMHAL
jgi:hypothetical protein